MPNTNNEKKYASLSTLQTFLDNLKTKFSNIGHKHTLSDITDYTVDSSLSSTSTNPIQNKVLNAEFDEIAVSMRALDLAIDGKSDASHSHNDLYYTETEIDQKLSGKANATHSHAISEVTNLQSSLDAKVPTSRTINSKPLTANVSLSASDVGAAPASHSHDDKYYTETEIDTKLASKSDTTHKHDDLYDEKGAAKEVSDTLKSHTDNTDIHVTTTNKSNWNSAYTHSTSAHARTDATKVEDSTTNGNIKINGTETNVYSHPNSGVSAGTYKSVTVNAQGHVTAGSNPTTLSGYGITDAETKTDASAKLTEAKTYTDTVASGKSDTSHKHDNLYDAKGAAADSLASAKSYTDTKTANLASTSTVDTKISTHNTAATAHSDIRDLITGLTTRLNTLANSDDTTLDQMSEIVDYIKNNKSLIDGITTNKVNVSDIVNNLTTNTTNKPLSAAQGVAIKALIDALQEELDSHTHAIADVSGLQSALDGKAASSHGTHVSYSTTAPVMDGTASVGTASTVARSDHKHPTDTSRASKTEFDTHVSDTTKHITSTERTNWNAAKTHADSAHAPSNAEKNQNAFSNIKVGTTTIAADTVTDTLELVGSNVTITPDTTNDKVTFSILDASTGNKGVVQLTNSTSSTSTTTAATPSSVKSAYDLANTAKTNAATAQTRADSAYTLAESKVDSLSDLGITATATELNYMDGVTSNVQTQLDSKVGIDHIHPYGVCSTAAATAAKTVTVNSGSGFTLQTGSKVVVKFTTTNTASSITLNVNGTGAKPIYYRGSAIYISYIAANKVYEFVYDGTNWVLIGDNTTGLMTTSNPTGTGYVSINRKEGTTSGTKSVAMGSNVTASSSFSVAFGTGSTASAQAAFAEGSYTTASGSASHAEGYETTASGSYSHAEGSSTEASGTSSHAEGSSTKASGNYSHAEGKATEASGAYSHVEGYFTKASSDYQHVQGIYNIEDVDGVYAHIVGNGRDDNDSIWLSNAHTIDWDGNGWFAGNVYVGGTSQSEGSPLVKESDLSWNLIYDSGEIPAIANSIAGINVSGYTKFRIAVRCYNDGDSYGDRTGSVIFKTQNGKTYQFPVWTNMFSSSINTVSAMADFELTDDWLICPHASKIIGDIDIFTASEGGTASNLTHTGSGIMKCTSSLSTLTISSLDQNSKYYFGSGSRVMVWGCK